MARGRLRFQPPPIRLTDELRWMLRRAFAPVTAPAKPLGGGGAAAATASRFALSPRIAARTPKDDLEREVGREAAAALGADRAWARATELKNRQAVDCLAAFSERLELPVVFLKYTALRLAGALAEAVRGANDTDILVPATRQQELHRALLADGFEGWLIEPEQHLPTLKRAAEGPIEIHRVLLGVRTPGARRSMRYDDLSEGGLLQRLDGPGECSVPARPVLAAHALVHGFVQHGSEPEAYPMFACLGDLIDLGLAGAVGSADGSLADEVQPYVSRELDRGDVEAVTALCRRLQNGVYTEQDALDLDDPADRLLAHALAGRLDEGYARRLQLGWLRPRLSDHSYPVQLAGTVGRTLFPGRTRLVTTYGSVDGGWALAALRVRHFRRMVLRLARAVVARLRPRARSR